MATLVAPGDTGHPADEHYCGRHLPSTKVIRRSRRRWRAQGPKLELGAKVACECGHEFVLHLVSDDYGVSWYWKRTDGWPLIFDASGPAPR